MSGGAAGVQPAMAMVDGWLAAWRGVTSGGCGAVAVVAVAMAVVAVATGRHAV